MSPALDLTSLENAISRLASGLAESEASPGSKLLRDGVIQRFEYTYELSWKMLRRYLECVHPSPDELPGMSFPDLIRTGCEYGLLKSGWDEWRIFRKFRGTTSHTYDENKAADVYRNIPGFLAEARHLLERLRERNIPPKP